MSSWTNQINTVQRSNIVQARKFSEQLDEAINRYTNRTLATAEIITELVKLAKEMRDATKRHQELGLSEDEVAFYEASCRTIRPCLRWATTP